MVSYTIRLTLGHEFACADDNKLGEIADIVHDCGCDLAFFGCQVEHLEDILESLRAVVNEVSRRCLWSPHASFCACTVSDSTQVFFKDDILQG
jgi:hypothetical protein